MEKSMKVCKERNPALDIIRIIAVIAVVMIHVSVNYTATFDTSSAEFIWANIFGSMSRLGVPLFVMVSGALMLDEDKNVEFNLVLKKVKTIACLLLFWSAVYCIAYRIALPLMKGEAINSYDIVSSLVLGHDHLWYLYMTIGLYLSTPFLRSFVKKDNKHLVLLFIGIALVVQFTLPMLNGLSLVWKDVSYCIKFIEKFDMGFFGGYIAYYMLGWYVVHIGVKHKLPIYIFGLLSLLAIVLYAQKTKDFGNAYSPMNIFVLMYSFAVFTLLNSNIRINMKNKTKKIIASLSNLSFGVYAIHLMCQTVVSGFLGLLMPSSVSMLILSFVLTSLLSFAVSFIASKIPIIKKSIRM